MRLQVVDLQGKKAAKLVAQAVRVYRSNLRQGGAWTKDRSGINRTGRKMWKQKGTGRARHGDRTAPQFVGGAKAHGPTGQENYKLRINRKMRQRALAAVLAEATRGGRVKVIEELPKFKKTKELAKLIKTNKLTNEQTNKKIKKILIVAEKLAPETVRAGRNLAGVALARPGELNALMVLEHDRIVITKEAIKNIKN